VIDLINQDHTIVIYVALYKNSRRPILSGACCAGTWMSLLQLRDCAATLRSGCSNNYLTLKATDNCLD
jgi:hypothetical protein